MTFHNNGYEEEYDDEYGEEEKTASARGPLKQLSPNEEAQVLRTLAAAGEGNVEFAKVMDILKNDSELRPLIFEHEKILMALTSVTIKAENMLSILTAAETEMYESSKLKEDQNELLEANKKLTDEKETLLL